MIIVLKHKIEGTTKVFMDADKIEVSTATITVSKSAKIDSDGLLKFESSDGSRRKYCVTFDRKYWQIEERSE